MNIKRLKLMRRAIMSAIIAVDQREVPEWRFDGTPMVKAHDVAAAMGISIDEARARMEQKDVYAASGEGVATRGVGTRTHHEGICQRANAIAYGKRRRRRHKRRSEK